jgi:hypothetical protein
MGFFNTPWGVSDSASHPANRASAYSTRGIEAALISPYDSSSFFEEYDGDAEVTMENFEESTLRDIAALLNVARMEPIGIPHYDEEDSEEEEHGYDSESDSESYSISYTSILSDAGNDEAMLADKSKVSQVDFKTTEENFQTLPTLSTTHTDFKITAANFRQFSTPPRQELARLWTSPAPAPESCQTWLWEGTFREAKFAQCFTFEPLSHPLKGTVIRFYESLTIESTQLWEFPATKMQKASNWLCKKAEDSKQSLWKPAPIIVSSRTAGLWVQGSDKLISHKELSIGQVSPIVSKNPRRQDKESIIQSTKLWEVSSVEERAVSWLTMAEEAPIRDLWTPNSIIPEPNNSPLWINKRDGSTNKNQNISNRPSKFLPNRLRRQHDVSVIESKELWTATEAENGSSRHWLTSNRQALNSKSVLEELPVLWTAPPRIRKVVRAGLWAKSSTVGETLSKFNDLPTQNSVGPRRHFEESSITSTQLWKIPRVNEKGPHDWYMIASVLQMLEV